MDRYDIVHATVHIRRDFGAAVKVEAEEMDGKVFAFLAGWKIDEGMYNGEWAMILEPAVCDIAWIASGDLEIHHG